MVIADAKLLFSFGAASALLWLGQTVKMIGMNLISFRFSWIFSTVDLEFEFELMYPEKPEELLFLLPMD